MNRWAESLGEFLPEELIFVDLAEPIASASFSLFSPSPSEGFPFESNIASFRAILVHRGALGQGDEPFRCPLEKR